MKHFLGLQLWHLFKYPELSKIAGQNDKLFIDLLNKVWVGDNDDDVEKFLREFIHESNENYPKDTFNLYGGAGPTTKKKKAVQMFYLVTFTQ